MSLYEEHMKFANDVLRIRNAMIDDTLNHRHCIFWDGNSSNHTKRFKIFSKHAYRPHYFGEVSTMFYSGEGAMATVITSKSMVYSHDDKPALLTIGNVEEIIPIVEYDESLHFQHSLVYTEEQLKALVVASVLRGNPYPTTSWTGIDISGVGKRFKISWYYIPTILKLMRYADNGII